MSSHTYDYLDDKAAADDSIRCSVSDVTAAKEQCAQRGTTKRCAEAH